MLKYFNLYQQWWIIRQAKIVRAKLLALVTKMTALRLYTSANRSSRSLHPYLTKLMYYTVRSKDFVGKWYNVSGILSKYYHINCQVIVKTFFWGYFDPLTSEHQNTSSSLSPSECMYQICTNFLKVLQRYQVHENGRDGQPNPKNIMSLAKTVTST